MKANVAYPGESIVKTEYLDALRARIAEVLAERDDTFTRLVHSERTRVENEMRIEKLENKIIRLENRVKDEYARRAYLEAALKIDDWDGDA